MNGSEAGEIGMATWVLLVLLGAVVIAAALFLMWWGGMPYGNWHGAQRKARRILRERLKRGEISAAEYETQRRELDEAFTPPPPHPPRG